MTKDVLAPLRWRIFLVLLYVLAPLLIYPTFLLVMQEPAHLSTITFRRYFEPLDATHFPYGYLVCASGFIFLVMFAFAIVIVREAKAKFVAISTMLAYIVYALGSYLYALYLGQRSAGTLPPADHAFILFAGLFLGIFYAESLIFRLFGQNALRFRPGRTWAHDPIVFVSFILAPVLGYPFLMVLAEALPDLSRLRMSKVSEPTHMPLFGYVSQLTALGFVLVYGAALTFAFVRTKRLAFFTAASAGAYVLYNVGAKIQVFVDRSMSAAFMRVCESNDLSTCLGFFEHGGLIGLSVTISALGVWFAFKYLGRVDLNDMSR